MENASGNIWRFELYAIKKPTVVPSRLKSNTSTKHGSKVLVKADLYPSKVTISLNAQATLMNWAQEEG